MNMYQHAYQAVRRHIVLGLGFDPVVHEHRRWTHPTSAWTEGRGGFMDVVAEVTDRTPDGHPVVALGHVYTQNGDLMYSPELVFVYHVDDRACYPLEITDHRMGLFHRVIDLHSGIRYDFGCRQQEELAALLALVCNNIGSYGYAT
jgi:hypothetical protein